MCAHSSSDSVSSGTDETTQPGPIEQELPSKARQLGAYLDTQLDAESEIYVKSRYIAEQIDLSAKEIGWHLRRLQDSPSITVEQWAYTNGTTWRLSKNG
jgi:hypothetical protein